MENSSRTVRQIREEALSCRNNVALFNISYFGKFYLCGPGASEAANYIFTSRVNRDINRTVYTCMLNRGGGVEGDCTVTGLETGTGGIVDPIFKGKGYYIGITVSIRARLIFVETLSPTVLYWFQ